MLAAGCDHLKSPQKIRELEDRVTKLAAEVKALKGGRGAKARTARTRRADPAAAAADGAGSGDAGSGEGAAAPVEAGAGSAEPAADGAGSAEAAAAEPAAGHEGEAGHDGEKPRDGEPGHDGEKPRDGEPGHDGEKPRDSDHDGEKVRDSETGHDSEKPRDSDSGHDGEKPRDSDSGHDGEKPRDSDNRRDRDKAAAGQDRDDRDHRDADKAAPVDPSERALQELRDVVAKSTSKHAEPAARGKPPVSELSSTWAYDGKTGPPTWGTLDPAWQTCLNGKTQSPVDIQPRAGTASPITFHYEPTPATLVDDGHTLRVRLESGSSIEIDHRSYQLVQMQFHAPSEHTIAGEHYPLEVQLIHQDLDGKLAAISVLYDRGTPSSELAALWSHWPRKVGGEEKLRKPFDPSVLLPETRTVYRYTGSLTTPPCTEGVTWNVMRRTLSDSKAHLDVFTKHYARNARNLQPLGGRKIE